MKSTIVVGLQWGDEGKGKVIDAISSSYDAVVRWNGGNNAGHTVVVDGKKFPLSLVPSAVLQKKKLLISQGVVLNPKVLLDEIALLTKAGFAPDLTIDSRCHIVMPYHQLMDAATEYWKGKDATGSLHLGIGYCYEDRNNRAGIRMEDLIRPDILEEKIKKILPLKLAIITKAYGMKATLSVSDIVTEYVAFGKKLKHYMGDVSRFVSVYWKTKRFLFEQAHGTMLDPVFGTYPFTVAPPTIASSVFPGIGIANKPVEVLGVVKAYTTRVGNGPFPTEQNNAFGHYMQTNGAERGTVSGRTRRCGWLDLPMLHYAVRLNGCTKLAVTKLDVLSGIKRLRVSTGYQCGRELLDEFPAEINKLSTCRPMYKEINTWSEDLGYVRKKKDLPKAARLYLEYLEKELDCPVAYVSVGPERKAFIAV